MPRNRMKATWSPSTSSGSPLPPSTNGGSAASSRPSEAPCGGLDEEGSPNTKVTMSAESVLATRTSTRRSDGNRPSWVSTAQASPATGLPEADGSGLVDASIDGDAVAMGLGVGGGDGL